MKEQKPKSKVAALSSYMCMVRSISKMSCFNLLSESFTNLISLLEDPDHQVKQATIRLLHTIAEYQSETMMTSKILKPYIGGFISMIESGDDLYSVAMSEMFEKLVEQFPAVNSENCFLIENLVDLTIALVKCAFKEVRGSAINVQAAATKCLVQLVINCYDWKVMKEFFEKFLDAVDEASKIPNKDHRLLLTECMFLSIGMMLYKARKSKHSIDSRYLINCYKAAVHSMQREKSILGEGLFIMGAVGCCLKQDFSCYTDEYLSYIKEAISNSKNDQIITAGYESLSYICRETNGISKDVLSNFFIPEIIVRMNDQTVPIDDRINLFVTIGDVALGSIEPILDNLQKVLLNFENAFQGTIEMLVVPVNQER